MNKQYYKSEQLDKQIVYGVTQLFMLLVLILGNYSHLSKLIYSAFLLWFFLAFLRLFELSSRINFNLKILDFSKIITNSIKSQLEASSIKLSGKDIVDINREYYINDNTRTIEEYESLLVIVFFVNFMLCSTFFSRFWLITWIIYSLLIWLFVRRYK